MAFVVATSDVDENTTRSRVWLDDAPLTAGDHDANPVWSPDGRFLAFTSRRGEKKGDSTLHIVPITASGEVRTVCTMPDGLGELTWSPDGRWIAFTSRTRDKRYEEKDESWQAPRKVERFLSRRESPKSPSRASVAVESTMSVNRIVASVRSSSSSGASPKFRALANSTASNAVSPTTHASWLGGISYASPTTMSSSVPSSIRTWRCPPIT